MPTPLLVSFMGAPASGRDTLMVQLTRALQRAGISAVSESSLPVAQSLACPRRFGAYLDRRLRDLGKMDVQVMVVDAPFLWPCLDGSLDPDEADPDDLAYLTHLHQRHAQLTFLLPSPTLIATTPALQILRDATAGFTAHLRQGLDDLEVPYVALIPPVDVTGQLVAQITRALQTPALQTA